MRRSINRYKPFAPTKPGFISIENQFKLLADNESLNELNFSEDEKVNKFFKEMQNEDHSPEENYFFEDFNAGYEENIYRYLDVYYVLNPKAFIRFVFYNFCSELL